MTLLLHCAFGDRDKFGNSSTWGDNDPYVKPTGPCTVKDGSLKDCYCPNGIEPVYFSDNGRFGVFCTVKCNKASDCPLPKHGYMLMPSCSATEGVCGISCHSVSLDCWLKVNNDRGHTSSEGRPLVGIKI
ncbi:hypothetical protein Pmar_PMAR010204 [Perkinsus marinus ATCC 50983]|uniref:Uncharacterized protein n=1 Tax=Perkinsus marinus (strain ATCC 50983 / TXsc) TaxID=423536 RepID=C5K540_PERM5|nr:hypothetical protein Pmar_PMAR010204 [Perkinsus marinus ATCC 50983]EER20462.1 hypothetical protein Pmar_PMAR010204 [Perkinsus marinus ATCC 50983]|eukprot:XP_002788666.1 hypothetical protein Pmar_PMAR010204 [Perkinsus marinus ATCC 50983]